MADFGSPVAGASTAINPIQTLSQVLNVQQQRQALQTGQATQQSAQAKAIQDSQAASEMQAAVPLMRDPVGNGLTDKNGNPTPNAYAIIKRAMPITGDTHYNDMMTAASSSVGYKSAWSKLTNETQSNISSRLAGVAADPKSQTADVLDALDKINDENSGSPQAPLVNKLTDSARTAITQVNARHGVDGTKQVVMGLSRGGIGNEGITGSGGVDAPENATVDTGGAIQPGTRAAPLQGGGFTPSGAPIAKVTPPENTVGPGGQIIHVPAGGSGLPSTAGGGAVGSGGPPTAGLQPLQRPGINAPKADQDAYNQQIGSAREEVTNARAAANDPVNGVQSTRFRNQQILDLIPHASTGPGMRLLNTLASRLPGSTGDAYQDLEHYTAQNSAALAQKMGVPRTNLGAETAGAAAGNVERNPGALGEITKTNDALNTAYDLYNRGLQKASNGGSDLSKVNAYQQAFGSNLDVNAIRWADAHRRNDADEIEQLTKKLGPKGISAAQQKLKTLKALSEKGDLPQ